MTTPKGREEMDDKAREIELQGLVAKQAYRIRQLEVKLADLRGKVEAISISLKKSSDAQDRFIGNQLDSLLRGME